MCTASALASLLQLVYTCSPQSALTFLLMQRPPTRSTLFPYTTLFRSWATGRPSGRSCRVWRAPLPTCRGARQTLQDRSEEHTSELQSHSDLVCRLLLEKNNNIAIPDIQNSGERWTSTECDAEHPAREI